MPQNLFSNMMKVYVAIGLLI